jgi:dipeptidase
MAYGSNVFNALVALYASVDAMPEYLERTDAQVSTDSFYWANRLIAALADPYYVSCAANIESYQMKVGSLGHAMLDATDRAAEEEGANLADLLRHANDRMASDLRRETDDLLARVLYTSSMGMRNGFARSDG